MRLLVLKEALPTGGAERQLTLIVRNLPAYWERRVWVMSGGPFADEIAADGYRVYRAPRRSRFDVRPALPLWRVLLEWRPDVVHSWDWMSTLAALPVCRTLGIPLVDATIRNAAVRPRGARQRRLSHAVSTLVVANSRAGLEAWGIGARKGRAYRTSENRTKTNGPHRNRSRWTPVLNHCAKCGDSANAFRCFFEISLRTQARR